VLEQEYREAKDNNSYDQELHDSHLNAVCTTTALVYIYTKLIVTRRPTIAAAL
jgi:hypothetical protein